MFDIGWTELLVIAGVAIVVVGPKDLPRMLRTFGQSVGKLRRMASEFQSTFNDALREAEQQADIDDMRKSVEKAGNFDPLGDIKKSFDPLKSAGEDLRDTVKAPISSNGRSPDGKPSSAAPKSSAPDVPSTPDTPVASSSSPAQPAAAKPTAKPPAKKAAATKAASGKPASSKSVKKTTTPKPAKPRAAKPKAETAGAAGSDSASARSGKS